MSTDPALTSLAGELFEGVMAPLVMSGALRPRHAIGTRKALALMQASPGEIVDMALFGQVHARRVRRARRLVPIDRLPSPTGQEWALSAALNDILQSASPMFQPTLRRSMAARILELAITTLEGIHPCETVREALSRHTWFAPLFDLTRTDTRVTWWTGSRVFRGEPPPARLQAWPEFRRVSVVSTRIPLLDLAPLAVDRDRLTLAIANLLERSPLTALATCTRLKPFFEWSAATEALITTSPGRMLALRALERLPPLAVDASLGRATRGLLENRRDAAGPALTLLADRVLAAATGHQRAPRDASPPIDATFARAVGAVVALRRLESGEHGWTEGQRRRIRQDLTAVASSDAGQGAAALLEGST